MNDLTELDRASLAWMERCNKKRVGFLGPTLRHKGPVEEIHHLVDAGYAIIVDPIGRGNRAGYWITKAGRRALAAARPEEDSE